MDDFFSIEYLEKFCERNPDSLAFAHLAARYIEIKQYDEALNLCEEGVKKHPDYAFGHYIFALAHYYLRNLDKAKDELEISLSYNPCNPQGWKILGSIDQDLNLPILTKESHLKFFLYDYFNAEAADKFFKSDVVSIISSEEEISAEELLPEEKQKTAEAVSDEEISQLFETNKESAGDEFEKAMDEVFKDTAKDYNNASIDESIETEISNKVDEFDKIRENELETREDEFTEAMDSFFKNYEEKPTIEDMGVSDDSEIETSVDEEPEISLDTSEDLDSEEPDTDDSEIEKDDLQKSKEEKQIEYPDKTEEIEKELSNVFDDEEPMDFSSVVADIISERSDTEKNIVIEEDREESNENKVNADEFEKNNFSQIEEIETESGDKIEQEEIGENIIKDSEAKPEEILQQPEEDQEKKTELPQTETAVSEKIFEDIEGEEEVITKDSPKKQTTTPGTIKDDTTHFGRPPILSPTLGEIYISQGRFEEAIDVFRQLLDKDPENARYERKINDLEIVIQKKKSSEK